MDENIMGDEDLNTSRLTFLASSTNQKKIFTGAINVYL